MADPNICLEVMLSFFAPVQTHLPEVLCCIGLPLFFGFVLLGWYLFGVLIPIFVLLMVTIAHLLQCCSGYQQKPQGPSEDLGTSPSQPNNNNNSGYSDPSVSTISVSVPQPRINQRPQPFLVDEATFSLFDPPPSYNESTRTTLTMDAPPPYSQATAMSLAS